MKRAALSLLLLAALPALAAENWIEAYNRGVNQVRTSSFQAGAQSLQRAVEEMPEENAAQHIPDLVFPYVPHFWLGIAKLNLGDPDGALREWKISEEQGAIQNTPYYAQLRDLIGRASSEKQHRAEAEARSKQEANGAIGRALSAQMDALTAGGDRSDTYHAAQRKLVEAKDTNAKAGIDVRLYKRAADLAEEAHSLFSAAADDAKAQRASRPTDPPPWREPAPSEVVIPFDDLPQPQLPAPVPVPLPAPIAESEALVAARVARNHRRRLHATTITATVGTTSTTGATGTTIASQTPEQQLAAEIDRRFRGLNPGEMLINAPHEMRVGNAERFVLRIASVGQSHDITVDLPAGGQSATSVVHVTPTMRATLSGNGFVIDKTSPEEQMIGGGTFTEWLWQVTPTDSGDHDLVVDIQILLDSRVKGSTKLWPVHVKANVIRSTTLFIKSNWQWLLTAMIIPLSGFLWRQRKKKPV